MTFRKTYFSSEDIHLLCHALSDEIVLFLQYLSQASPQSPYAVLGEEARQEVLLQPEWRTVSDDFSGDRSAYACQQLLDRGANIVTATRFPVRIELRDRKRDQGAAQIAARGIPGNYRSIAVSRLSLNPSLASLGYELRLSGYASLEFNQKGVTKALPLRYLDLYWNEVLTDMGYRPGPVVDALSRRMLVAADGDGTTYGKPAITRLPGLADSPVRQPLVAYLQKGGVFLLISGNDMGRTAERVVHGLPAEYRSNVIFVADGGAGMAWLSPSGDLQRYDRYQEKALEMPQGTEELVELDCVYIGDDGHATGNDLSAFAAVGWFRSILVSPHVPVDVPFTNMHYLGGLEDGTARFLRLLDRAWIRDTGDDPVFVSEKIEKWISLPLG